jgi:hypothetical protein
MHPIMEEGSFPITHLHFASDYWYLMAEGVLKTQSGPDRSLGGVVSILEPSQLVVCTMRFVPPPPFYLQV